MALLLTVLVLGGVVAYHHVEPSGMDDMASGAVCLAVIGGGATLLVAALLPRWLPPWRALRLSKPRATTWIVPAQTGLARAGPLYLQLSVLRR